MKAFVTRLALLLCALATVPVLAGVAQADARGAAVLPIQASRVVTPFDRGGGCQNQDGVKVAPCRVAFDTAHPGPDMVVVDSSGKAVTERDNCASRGIATIASNGDFTFTVTAGSMPGMCFAHFVRRGQDGSHGQNGAVLTVVNRL
jgi:hypothetical protein